MKSGRHGRVVVCCDAYQSSQFYFSVYVFSKEILIDILNRGLVATWDCIPVVSILFLLLIISFFPFLSLVELDIFLSQVSLEWLLGGGVCWIVHS